MNKPAKRTTIVDVAKAAGVALGTASNVINGKASVAADIRARVEKAIFELGYRPNLAAQSIRSQSTRAVGIIIPNINVPAFAAFFNAAQEVLHAEGYVVVLASSLSRVDREIELLSEFQRRQVDAVIISGASENDPRLLRAYESIGVPIIMLDRDMDVDAILIDYAKGTEQAVDYLLGLEHRRIALITGGDDIRPSRERIKGFIKAHSKAKLTFDNRLLVSGSFSPDYGYEKASLLLRLADRPTAIIAGGIEMLAGVLRAVREAGLSIPHDISIIGTTDTELARLFTPAVTVVTVDYASMGTKAARHILELSREAPRESNWKLKFKSDLLIRDSCAAPPQKSDSLPAPRITRSKKR